MSGTGGIIPAARFLRRRAAAEDLGADVDAFWSAAPRLYDFSQQQLPLQAPRPPSPPPAARPSPSPPPPEQEARDQCLVLLRRSPSPPPATRLSPLPAPEPRSPGLLTPPSPPAARRSPSSALEPRGPCLLTLLRGSVRWGARRSVTYGRHRAADGGVPRPQDHVVVVERPAAVELGREESKAHGAKKMKRLVEIGKEESGRANKRVVVKTEENRRVTRSSLRRRQNGGFRRAKKVPFEVVKEEAEAASEEVGCQDDKHGVVKNEKTRNRKRERSGCDHRGDAAKRAKKILPVKKEENEEGSSGDRKRKRPAASSLVKREVVSTDEEVRVYHRRGRGAAKLAEKVPKDEEEQEESKPTTALAPKPSSPRGKVDRWSARRYAAGEAALLDILRARGASAGKPAPRAELRAEARRHIGDTGLLDHLLLHTVDKVPAGSAERIRRRYNVDGALEYFLEPAGLKALRKEAGVDDPFWVPPPGWKLGDPVSPDAVALAVKKQVEELAAELAVVKRQMKTLSSNLVHVSKEAYISWKGYDCMLKANENLGKELLSLEEKFDSATQANGELKEELLILKENYENMAEKNAKLEEQVVDISSCLQFLKDDLPVPEAEGGEHMLMLEQPDHCVEEPSKADTDKQESSAGNVPGDVVVDASKATATDGSISEKRTSRKCSMRICKPQGTFQWPNTSAGMATGEACSPKALPEPLTPGGDLIVTNFDAVIYNVAPSSLEEYLATDGLPTSTSASSTTAASTRFPLLPIPASPLQQLLTNTTRDDDLQTVQPCSGGLNSQLPHKDLSSSASAPCLLEAGKKALVLGGGNVGTELALTTPSY